MNHRLRLCYCVCVFILLGMCSTIGCQSTPATEELSIWEGPQLNYGRTSATLGAVQLKNGRLVVIGGSPTEYPFVPLEGTKAIEIVDPKCVLSPKCIQEKEKCKCWFDAGISVDYPLSGNAFLLPDGRIFVLSSVFILNPASNRVSSKPASTSEPSSGPVSAVIIDINTKSVTPIYRPKGNVWGNPPLSGNGPALMQRAFDRSLQLRDGRIVRIGGYMRYTDPTPVGQCKSNVCTYCIGTKCSTSEKPFGCKEDKDCPEKRAKVNKFVLDDIEVYTPPTTKNPLGTIQHTKMKEGRSSASAIELKDGRVLITGGWGPKGYGSNQDYIHSYYLDVNQKKLVLSDAPQMLFYREDHSMLMMKDGRVLITGGTNHKEITIRESEIFDPVKGQFLNAPSMNLSREDHVGMALGPWLLFLGGEVNDKADQIRNSIELFDASTAAYIGPSLMFSRPAKGEYKSFAGTTDFGVSFLDKNTLFLFGGIQGLQDRDGEYISAGTGTRRSLVIQYHPR